MVEIIDAKKLETMNTLILNGTEKDLKLLLDISKKIGIDLKVVKEKTALGKPTQRVYTAKEEEFRKNFKEAMKEVKKIRSGKIKARNLDEVLNEL